MSQERLETLSTEPLKPLLVSRKVTVRWTDGYMEEFTDVQDVRAGHALLYLGWKDKNRHIPLTQVRWYSVYPPVNETKAFEPLALYVPSNVVYSNYPPVADTEVHIGDAIRENPGVRTSGGTIKTGTPMNIDSLEIPDSAAEENRFNDGNIPNMENIQNKNTKRNTFTR